MASIIIGVVFVCLGASCAAIGSLLVHREIVAVNRKVSEGEQISLSFMYPGKMQKVKAEYKRLYPTGKVETWRVRLLVATFVFLALASRNLPRILQVKRNFVGLFGRFSKNPSILSAVEISRQLRILPKFPLTYFDGG